MLILVQVTSRPERDILRLAFGDRRVYMCLNLGLDSPNRHNGERIQDLVVMRLHLRSKPFGEPRA